MHKDTAVKLLNLEKLCQEVLLLFCVVYCTHGSCCLFKSETSLVEQCPPCAPNQETGRKRAKTGQKRDRMAWMLTSSLRCLGISYWLLLKGERHERASQNFLIYFSAELHLHFNECFEEKYVSQILDNKLILLQLLDNNQSSPTWWDSCSSGNTCSSSSLRACYGRNCNTYSSSSLRAYYGSSCNTCSSSSLRACYGSL
jgi:hypothetical protein